MAAPNRSNDRLQRLALLQGMMPQPAASPAPPPQTDILGQLTQLYQLQQNMDMNPLRQEAVRAEVDALKQRTSGAIQPNDILQYFGQTDQALPPELQHLIQTPQSQAAVAQKKATKLQEQNTDTELKRLQAGVAGGNMDSAARLFQMGHDVPLQYFEEPSTPVTMNPMFPDASQRASNREKNSADPLNPANLIPWLAELLGRTVTRPTVSDTATVLR